MKIFPTKQKFSKWSLPAKASYIGFWFAVVTSIVSYLFSSCQKPVTQHANGNRNTQASTTGNNSPVTIIGEQKNYLPAGDNQEPRPYVTVEVVNPILRPDGDGKSRLRYKLKSSENMAAYDIRKGHRIFNEKKECLKHFYDFGDQYLLDLPPGGESLIHKDNLEKLIVEGNELDKKFLKLQLIITYKKSKDEKNKLYYSLENFVLLPINCKEGYCNEFLIAKPSSVMGTIEEFIDECKEFK